MIDDTLLTFHTIAMVIISWEILKYSVNSFMSKYSKYNDRQYSDSDSEDEDEAMTPQEMKSVERKRDCGIARSFLEPPLRGGRYMTLAEIGRTPRDPYPSHYKQCTDYIRIIRGLNKTFKGEKYRESVPRLEKLGYKIIIVSVNSCAVRRVFEKVSMYTDDDSHIGVMLHEPTLKHKWVGDVIDGPASITDATTIDAIVDPFVDYPNLIRKKIKC